MSVVETTSSTLIGLGVAYLTQMLVFPLFDIEIPHSSHAAIVAVFTFVSLVRSFLVRRLFNWIGK
jgi:hypothetical protein